MASIFLPPPCFKLLFDSCAHWNLLSVAIRIVSMVLFNRTEAMCQLGIYSMTFFDSLHNISSRMGFVSFNPAQFCSQACLWCFGGWKKKRNIQYDSLPSYNSVSLKYHTILQLSTHCDTVISINVQYVKVYNYNTTLHWQTYVDSWPLKPAVVFEPSFSKPWALIWCCHPSTPLFWEVFPLDLSMAVDWPFQPQEH